MPRFLQNEKILVHYMLGTCVMCIQCMQEGDACGKFQMQFEIVTAWCNHGYLMRNGNI